MTIEEIVQGESKNVEFKETLPKNSERYTKTIIAFANSQGGKLIVGIKDKTREIVGVDQSSLFLLMDSISNAISDSCEPQIVPEIEPYSLAGKTVIIVTVLPGPHRPYYLKSKGKEDGTYIRAAGTSRNAGPDKIKELEMEGARVSWDELTCVGYPVTETAIRKLCRDMNRYRKDMQLQKNSVEKLPTVTRSNLENWNVLKKLGDEYHSTNAFALLTGNHFRYSKTQCAVFAGTDRGEFIDKQEYSGPLYEQIEAAYAFVLRNIRRSAKVEGLIRKEEHELPPTAIREMIVNAHCHRNYLDNSCVQVALYDDRLEVTSPGGLYMGLTLEEALDGRSRQRNRAIAEIFNQMGLIEAWGNGLRSIRKEAAAYHLKKPDFIEMPDTFRVNLYRKSTSPEGKGNIGNESAEGRQNIGKASAMHRQSIGDASVENGRKEDVNVTATQSKILALLRENPRMTGNQLADEVGISKRNIEENIRKLKELGVIVRRGSSKSGFWDITQEP